MANPPPKDLEIIDEPKTLSEAELNSYREAAREIVNTHTYEEATRIFLAGLISPAQLPHAPQAPTSTPAPPSESKPSSSKILGKPNRPN